MCTAGVYLKPVPRHDACPDSKTSRARGSRRADLAGSLGGELHALLVLENALLVYDLHRAGAAKPRIGTSELQGKLSRREGEIAVLFLDRDDPPFSVPGLTVTTSWVMPVSLARVDQSCCRAGSSQTAWLGVTRITRGVTGDLYPRKSLSPPARADRLSIPVTRPEHATRGSRLAARADALDNPTRPADVQTVTEKVDVPATRTPAGAGGPRACGRPSPRLALARGYTIAELRIEQRTRLTPADELRPEQVAPLSDVASGADSAEVPAHRAPGTKRTRCLVPEVSRARRGRESEERPGEIHR